MRHKHAEVFEAAAQGKADEFEVSSLRWGDTWVSSVNNLQFLYNSPALWYSRRKPKTHVVNGFTVPEPLEKALAYGTTYYIEKASRTSFMCKMCWNGDMSNRLYFNRGIAHATEEGAIANCKARLGIDPYKD